MLNPIQIRSFVTAMTEGSLSAAARKLGLTQPAVSQHLAQLEAVTGQVLLTRSNRGVRATQAGQIVLEHGNRILESLADLEESLDSLNGDVTGTLTVTTNTLLNRLLLVPIFSKLLQECPKLTLRLVPTDAFLDLERDGLDMALRTGTPGDGPGVVRRIAALDMLHAATPAYLDRIGRPSGPEELARLDYIQFRDDPDQSHTDLMIDGGVQSVPITRAFGAHNADLLGHAVRSGLGFARLPRFLAQPEIDAGELEEILPDCPSTPKQVFLLQQAHGVDQARNRRFRSLLFEELGRHDHIQLAATARAELREMHAGLDPFPAPA